MGGSIDVGTEAADHTVITDFLTGVASDDHDSLDILSVAPEQNTERGSNIEQAIRRAF